jgi:hypothetical protein
MVIEEIRRERNRLINHAKIKRNNRVNKYAKIGEAILSGNMREFKAQVVANFQRINRKYVEQEGNTLLHFICQVRFIIYK